MSLREDVLEVLRSSEAARIRFSFPSLYNGTPISVDQSTFLRVAAAIEAGRITISSEGIPSYWGGQYDYSAENASGVFRARPVRNSRHRKSVVIHEAVHASFDLTRSTLAEVDNEAASYLAQFVYLRITYATPALTDSLYGRLYEILWQTADSIQRRNTISETQLEVIRRRIARHPHYSYVLTEGCLNGESECQYIVYTQNG
jgi:hypothetical protein